jgi:hypothetical protein
LCRTLNIKLEDVKNGASLAIFFVNKSFAKLCLLLLLLVVGLWRKQGAAIFNFFNKSNSKRKVLKVVLVGSEFLKDKIPDNRMQ